MHKKEASCILSAFSCCWISEWGDQFGLSLAVCYRLCMCVCGAVLGIVSSLHVVCRNLHPPDFSFPCLPLALICSARDLRHLFIGFCILLVLPFWLTMNPSHSLWNLLSSGHCFDKAVPALPPWVGSCFPLSLGDVGACSVSRAHSINPGH